MIDRCLRRKFSLRGCHTDCYGLGKRRSISVRFGGLVQLITRGSIVLVHPITNEDGGALGQYALDKDRYPDRYDHIWEGDYAKAFEGFSPLKW